jgi:error-prone DNA polymerase
MGFVHLHVHSQYSFMDGAASLDKLLNKTAALGMYALALTDHDRLTGAIKFYEKARARGIKPLIGAEITLEGGYHLTLLCKDTEGYSNLCRLLTQAHLSNRNKKPQASKQMLQQYSPGLIALSGCARGEIPVLFGKARFEECRKSMHLYREAFGGDFYVELNRYPSRKGMNDSYKFAAFAKEEGMPIVATNNVHYVEMQDYRLKELLNAIGHNVPVSQLQCYHTVEQYLKSPQEMTLLFKDFPEAIEMTAEIAARCNLQLELGNSHFPTFNVPAGETSYSYLSRLAFAGASTRYGLLKDGIRERLEYELDTIRKLGFCSYFLVCWDIVHWARERSIRCQARGSAVDSLVVYSLGISNVDPVEYDLLFERFMHSLRQEPPDIDLDVDRRRRDEVKAYIYQKYGPENVASVGTVSTYMARGTIRDVGKALQLPQLLIEEACKGIHYLSASQLMEYADSRPELKGSTIYRRDDLTAFFKLCNAIDGFPKYMSVHLGGLLIGQENLTSLVPLEWSSGGDVISQYDKNDIERLGIVKMDLLALPTLTVIEDTLSNIRNSRGITIDLSKLDRNDPRSFAMLQAGCTIGTFQLESPAQREMAGRLLPDSFEDIIISISLVRPGPLKCSVDKEFLPRRHGTGPVTYLHPLLRNALNETLGVILYQEQVLKVAHDLAGMSYAEADGFRRAMTHDRGEEEMEKMRESFISRAIERGVSQAIAKKVFQKLAAFAAYGFCKAHAAAYAILAYQTLWLKCHYPAEFTAALLSNQPMGYYPACVLVADAKRMGVKILPLDINSSSNRYTVEDGAIRVSLRQLKGMPEKTLNKILKERSKSKFTSLEDFVWRTSLNRRLLERLVRVGAFDSFGSRDELLVQVSRLPENNHGAGRNLKLRLEGILSKIPASNIVNVYGNKKAKMLAEREILSLNLSAHPLDFLTASSEIIQMKDLPSIATGTMVSIAGSVIRYQTPPTRGEKRVVYVIMEDGTGLADVTVFSNVQEKCGQVLFREGWLLVKGRVQRRGSKSLSIIADKLTALPDWQSQQNLNHTSTLFDLHKS